MTRCTWGRHATTQGAVLLHGSHQRSKRSEKRGRDLQVRIVNQFHVVLDCSEKEALTAAHALPPPLKCSITNLLLIYNPVLVREIGKAI